MNTLIILIISFLAFAHGEVDPQCLVVGCSGTNCVNREFYEKSPWGTTCEYKAWYGCFKSADCKMIKSKCTWVVTPSLSSCLKTRNAPQYTQDLHSSQAYKSKTKKKSIQDLTTMSVDILNQLGDKIQKVEKSKQKEK